MKNPRLADGALAALAAVSVTVGGLLSPEEPNFGPAPFVIGLLVGLLVLFRRRWPVGQAVVAAFALLSYNALNFPAITETWGVLIPLYAAAASGHLLAASLLGGGFWAAVTAWLVYEANQPFLSMATEQAEKAAVLGLGVALGAAVHTHRRWRSEVAERLQREREEQERTQRERLLGERMRIARELHDVTAHTLAVVGVQLHVAADGIDDEDRTAAKEALTVATKINTEAINELRGTLKLLRATDSEPGSDAGTPIMPAPGLSGLSELIERTTAAGLKASLTERGGQERREIVSPSAGLTIYRVIQESLTNALKHAAATAVQVDVNYGRDQVEITVTDDGRGGRNNAPSGHGIIGMRERVTSLGGVFEAGPGATGFTVRAAIPASPAAHDRSAR